MQKREDENHFNRKYVLALDNFVGVHGFLPLLRGCFLI
jgi:hypothetical protein